MAKSPIIELRLRFRGRDVEGVVAPGGWKITDPNGVDIDWRVLLVAPDLSAPPIVLVEAGDVTLLAGEFKLSQELLRRLKEALAPGPAPVARAVGKSDQALAEAHRRPRKHDRLQKEYQKLGSENPGLNSRELFLCALQRGLFRSLCLYDEVHRDYQRAPVPVSDYLYDLQMKTGLAVPADWVASACDWNGQTTLYENPTTEPWSEPPGRRIVLEGSQPYRTNLSDLVTTALEDGGDGDDQSPPGFEVWAAKTTS